MEKIKGETDKDYALFCRFMQMTDRDLVKFGLLNKLSMARISSISAKNKWFERARQIDKDEQKHYLAIKKEALAQLAQDQAQEQAQIQQVSSKLVLEGLTKYLIKMLQDPKYNLKVQDLEKVNNILKNIPAKDTEDEVDLSHLSDKDLEKLSAIIGKE